MDDRLADLLKGFELRARLFQAGPLYHSARFDAEDGLGYIHVVHTGVLQVEGSNHPPLLIDGPSLFFYMNPTSHRLLPKDTQVDRVCASIEFGAGLRNPLARAIRGNVPGVVGMTPGSYLGEWRLGVAQSLLRKGKPVQLVADVAGTGSASALSRAFRAQVGQTPTEWLRQYRAGH